ncbi:secreted endonuclease [Legionella rubrilucens]|uniref:Secreted endonuclease n=1 Tax=Legionella rubrilucens TaxID=458 RepID=A0A0W0XWW1_9GAMM|nr:hypothetical protein [Legionella rubrilucens]KTD48959.1 secreted endonuclease [Legionella rubrilucens]
MLRFVVMAWAMFMLNSCAAHDERYYRLNPPELIDVMKACPEKQPRHLSCDELKPVFAEVSQMAYQLQINPQRFGSRILSLQEELGKQQALLEQNPNQPQLAADIEKKQQQLAELLAIVRWLEAPEG